MFFPNTDQIDLNPPPVPARPAPKSQKEATMMAAAEPTEDAISMLLDFGKTDSREVVIRYLKAKHNNIEAAAAALLDDEDISQAEQAASWDEGAFSADRDGEAVNQLLHPMGTTTPHTRANSPAGNRANLHPSSKDQEDADLAAALSASQQDLGLAFQQESGVVRDDGVEEKRHFGPATKEYYESSRWAMVPTSQETAEIILDVGVEQRKNVSGEPRFLKHVPSADYLSALLTICHAIAGVREAMLVRDHVRREYGEDEDWWRGHSISLPRIVHTDSGTPLESDDKHDGLVAEVQRLMAFLDMGERSYVSAGALTQTAAIRDVSLSDGKAGALVQHFMQEWMVAGTAKARKGDMSGLFTTTVFSEDLNKADECEKILLHLPVSAREGESVDLSELLDNFFWGQDMEEMSASKGDFVNSPADVLVMRLVQEDPAATQLRAEIPFQFYMDKYMRENRETAQEMRKQIAQGKGRLRRIGEIEKKLTTWKHPKKDHVEIDAQLLLKHTHGHFSGRHRSQAEKALEANGVSSSSSTIDEEGKGETTDQPDYDDITHKLDTLITSISSKLTLLASEKEKTRKALATISKTPTLPSLDAQDRSQLQHRYTLRGVATKPNITYLLRPKDEGEDSSEDEDEAMLLLPSGQPPIDEDGTPEGMQWWRIEYDLHALPSGEAKVTKTRAPDYDVLRAVELEWREALLVYANDDANDVEHWDPVLPRALEEFVERDNAVLRRELVEMAGRTAPLPPAYDFDGLADGGMVRELSLIHISEPTRPY